MHGYIDFTALERKLFDTRVCQRLRNISQTGLAQLVYPEARSTRFAHSLGVMHLSSSLVSAAFRNSSPETRASLGDAISAAVRDSIGSTVDPGRLYRELGEGYLNVLQARNFARQADEPVVTIAEQALRLAGLFHDLGHLPFSHDFEDALDIYWARLTPAERAESPIAPLAEPHEGRSVVHETVGHGLARLLLLALGADEFERAAFDVAYRILNAQPLPLDRPRESPADEALRWLHSLIAGDVDADRCDFVIRDGRNYGFEFATFDLSRLLDNMTAFEVDGRFTLAVQGRGVSAVESFLMGRYRSYQLGVRHHKVAQIGAALRHSTAALLALRTPEPFMADIGAIANAATGAGVTDADGILARFPTYDDIWWMAELRRRSMEDPDDAWLDLVCWRGKGVRSLWKRPEDIADLVPDVPTWNRAMDGLDALVWHRVSPELLERGVLLMRHTKFRPWTMTQDGESELRLVQGGNLRHLSTVSPLMRSLNEAWMEEPHVQAFRLDSSSVTPDEVLAALSRAAQEVA